MSGGLKVVVIYAQRLMRRGHIVCLLSPPAKSPSIPRRLKSWLSGNGWPSGVVASHLDGSGIDHRILDDQRPITNQDVPDADIVIATWWETAEWVSALDLRKGTKVYFIQHHEIFPFASPERSRNTYWLPLNKIVISSWLKQLMSAEYGDDSAVLIPNSVDSDQFFAPARGKQAVPTVGFLYSTVSFKSLHVSLAALKIVKERLGDLRGVAFGSEQVSAQMPLPLWIDFHHLPPQDKIRLLYGRCDVWLCGSSSEGFHLPPLEAMACRCPVVSTRVGGPMDIIKDGWNGFLTEVGDSEALADRVMHILKLDQSAWRQMSDAAFMTASSYTWDDATELLETTLQALVREAAIDASL
jgi:glycosyltransferase involved in cell wall biosynthesis